MEQLRDAGRQFLAGGCAGIVEVSLMHPLDLIKTRFQAPPSGPDQTPRYKGLADCFRKIYKTEGASAFYKGIGPPLIAETQKRATKFLTFEQYKRVIGTLGLPNPVTFALAGLGSGLTEALVICPFEVVKVRLQTEKAVSLQEQKSTARIAADIYAKAGMGGLYRGIFATMGRDGVWNAFYFGIYNSVKDRYPPPESDGWNMAYRLSVGFASGTLASVANIPFDVAKSRIQGPQPDPKRRKYHNLTQTMRLVYKEEGFLVLYTGLLPKVMRLGPGGAIMLVVYETIYEWLS